MDRRGFISLGAVAGLMAVAHPVLTTSSSAAATKPLVALTFDDGPDPRTTPYILTQLRAKGVKATFFVTGENAVKYPAIIKRIHREGHVIGNHSYAHGDFSTMTYAQALADIKKTQAAVKAITGVAPTLFRFPYGKTSTNAIKAMNAAGFSFWVGWHSVYTPKASINNGVVYEGDWVCTVTDAAVEDHISLNAKSQAIILLHDGYSAAECNTSRFSYVTSSINELRGAGYDFGVPKKGTKTSSINMGTFVIVAK